MTPPPKRRKVDAEPSPSLSTPPSTTTSLPPLSPALLPLAPNPPLYPHQRLERVLIPPGRSRSHGGAGTPNSPVNSNSSPSTDPTSVPKGLLSQASIHRQASRGSPVVSSSSGSGPGRGDALSLEGYKDVRIISVHYDDTVVCRAVSTTRGDMKVFIKLSLSANPIATASFKAEATLLATLHEAGVHNVSKIISREVGKLGAMLIAEDERVTFFKDVFFPPERTSAPHWTDSTTILHALDACVQLVRLISSIHSLSIVHGAIRPSTVSFSVFSEVHIHDFSCAFRSAASTEGVIAPVRERGMREESLPYLAPECTGRVGKSADYRSDYYSIGALMFEMFTGRTPFAEAIDPLEVIHAHIARRPLLATYYDHSIPEPLAQLIAKLLEKSPDARYQTSQGLIVDLEKIMDLIRRNSSKLSRWCPEDPAFVIGSIDEAAHFRLPPATRMYGRTASLETLLASYARVEKTGKSEVVIIKGLSGTGKSSLTETVRKPVLRSLGYYTTVKFDQIVSPVPDFALSQALSSCLRQILSESEAQLVVWRRRLAKALRREGRILADVLPMLENVFEPGWLDTLPPIVPLGSAESENRFQNIVRRVLRTFARAGKPLVVVFDDLQWTTASDVNFILSLINKEDTSTSTGSSMLILCVYRDDEVGFDHIITTSLLPNFSKINLTITLDPLKLDDVVAFVSDSLRRSINDPAEKESSVVPEDANIRGLSELILQKTAGNPLFIAQLLKALNAEGLFTFDFALGRWIFDLALIASQSVSADVVQLLQGQVAKFPLFAQEALKVAACIGNEEIGVVTLARAIGKSVKELVRDLSEVVQSGMLIPVGELDKEEAGEGEASEEGKTSMNLRIESAPPRSYRFFHDRCQQAAYSLVPVSERSAMHYSIGQRLVAAITPESLWDGIFDLANQLNHGISIISTKEERTQLARFNHLAATKANKSTAFDASRKHLAIAWDLLGGELGWSEEYELMSSIGELLVEVEYSLADYPAAQEYVRIFLLHSRDSEAKLRIYAHSVRSAAATGDPTTALTIGREALAMVGIEFPDAPEDAAKLADAVREETKLSPASIHALKNLPRMTDPVASGALVIMAALVAPTYFIRIDLLGALSSLALRETVQHGLGDAGAFMLTLHAVLVAGQFSQHAESLAFGQVAISYFEKYGGTALACPTYKVMASHISVWSIPIRDTIAIFRKSVSYGIEYRDAEYLGFGSAELCSYSLLAGMPVSDLVASLDRFSVLVRKYRNEISSLYIGVVHQTALALVGRSSHPCEIEGQGFSLDDYHIAKDKSYAVTLHLFHMFRLMLAIFFDDRVRAQESMKAGRQWMHGGQGILYPAFFQLFESVALYDNFALLTPTDHVTLATTQAYFEDLCKVQPSNFGHMKQWLQAEECRSRKDWPAAMSYYDAAILAATEAQFIHLSACMNERCASMLKSPKLAAGYLLESYSQYKAFGCVTKLRSMEAVHPLLFPSVPKSPIPEDATPPATGTTAARVPSPSDIVFQALSETGSSTVLDDVGIPNVWTSSEVNSRKGLSSESMGSRGSRSVGSRSILDVEFEDIYDYRTDGTPSEAQSKSHLTTELDLRTVVSASSVIAGEISVDGVVQKLLNLALRTAGAELCLLVLDKAGTLCAEAIATTESSEVKHLRRLDAIDVQPDRYPCSVINYVARSRVMVVNDLDASGEAISDPYLKTHRPKSILCLALYSQQRVIGVLYMENTKMKNAFTPDRLEILLLISGQAASAVDKARLVQDLKAANNDLKRSQTQLEGYNRNLEETVANRTVELLDKNDRLVAEVYERERAQKEMMDAKEVAERATHMKSQFLANMSHEIRTPFNAVVALAGLLLDSPLNPVQTDYVETIKNSSDELLVVINDILDYSKIELDHLSLHLEKVQLRSALERSMDMVAERAASKSIELALILEQGDIDIVTDLTRLRQVVVNLLSNAVKFTGAGEILVTASSEMIPLVEGEEQQVRVRISVQDSGIGIAEKDFSKLFMVYSQVDGSETTKLFGGTGLGLAISRKLSVLLGGDILVESTIGTGSTFTLEFVTAAAEPPEIDPCSVTQNPDFAGKRCLIVDNHVASRNVVQQLTTEFGLVVEAPADLTMAYARCVEAFASGEPFDVVIVDAFLPAFGAQTLIRRLRQRGITAPAIALTRMGSPIHEVMRQLDCRFCIKPIKRNRLHQTLRQVFPLDSRKSSPSDGIGTSSFPANLGTRFPLSILCAEDNPVNVKVITHLLRRMGYTTDIAEDGVVALEKAQKKRYDLIFMDVNMPNMDGLECSRRLVELIPDATTRPYIVAMTANSMVSDRGLCLEAGCDGYVSKPILINSLIAALNEASAKKIRGTPTVTPHHVDEEGGYFELVIPTSIAGRRSSRVDASSRPVSRQPSPLGALE